MAKHLAQQVVIYGDDFWEFYNSLKPAVQAKIDWVIGLAIGSVMSMAKQYAVFVENV